MKPLATWVWTNPLYTELLTSFLSTGNVEKKKYDPNNLPRKLTDEVQFFIMHLVLDQPGIMLAEIQDEVLKVTNVELAQSTICQFLHRHNFSRQKMHITATRRDEALRLQFAGDLSVYKSEMFIFLDETGTDRRDTLRKYGYSWRGKPAVAQKLLVRGQHLSLIAIMISSHLMEQMSSQ